MKEFGGHRESAINVIRMRATECDQAADCYKLRAIKLRSLANKLEEIERSSQSFDGQESGPHIGVGSDAEEALWSLAVNHRIFDMPSRGLCGDI